MSDCDGSCCVVFPLSSARDDLLDEERFGPDGPYIYDMTIPLSDEEAAERATAFGVELQGPGPFFACRHWNELSRLCTAYEKRPKMCARYPYMRSGGCEHDCSCRGTTREWEERPRGKTVRSKFAGLWRIIKA